MPYLNAYNKMIADEVLKLNQNYLTHAKMTHQGPDIHMSKVGGKKKEDIYDEVDALEGGSGFAEGSVRDTGEGKTKGISGDGVKKYKKKGGFNFTDLLKSPENIATSLLATSPIAPITPFVSSYLFGKKLFGGKSGAGSSGGSITGGKKKKGGKLDLGDLISTGMDLAEMVGGKKKKGGKLVPKSEMKASTLSGFGKSGGGSSGGGSSGGGKSGGAFNPLNLLNPVGLISSVLGGRKKMAVKDSQKMKVQLKEGKGLTGGNLSERKGMGMSGGSITGGGMSGGKKLTPWIMLVKKTLANKKLGLKGVKEAVKYIKDNNLYKK
jgi:hypothetical protein